MPKLSLKSCPWSIRIAGTALVLAVLIWMRFRVSTTSANASQQPVQAGQMSVALDFFASLKVDEEASEGRRPGDLLSDLETALRLGEASPLVRLKTSGKTMLFGSWRNLLLEKRTKDRIAAGMVFSKISESDDGLRVYRVSARGVEVDAVIQAQRIDHRWHIVGFETVLKETVLKDAVNVASDEEGDIFDEE